MTPRQKIRLAVAAVALAFAAGKTLTRGPHRSAPAQPAANAAGASNQVCMTQQESNGFDREALFGTWQHQNGNCRNTRARVLASESVEAVSGTCSIEAGEWIDPYTGDTIRHPRDLDIDHIVPLKEAWKSGAWRWSQEERVAYANDTEVLLAVGKHANRSKGDKDPGEWLPPLGSYRREYARRWAAIKVKRHLSADPRERQILSDLGVTELPVEAPEGCAGI